jgi:hypothetical protein
MNAAAKAILEALSRKFMDENGSEYYKSVHYYENQKLAGAYDAFSIKLDGEFSARQLRMIATALDEATAAESADITKSPV